ncbi:small ubiquitin-related modifier 2 isoform X2 [Notamacropus eugenii]|uniref:small ubiquitin-related modifier 2 isoform X2 n=1 Tax=Notamacropus eugenii TaxID=9315 RepID=UPI003B67EDCD
MWMMPEPPAGKEEGVKTENNDHINLKVAGQDGSVVQFKIKRHTPLSKLMKAYCERQGLSMRQIRFRFDGQPINETDTPAQSCEGQFCKYQHFIGEKAPAAEVQIFLTSHKYWKWRMKIQLMYSNSRQEALTKKKIYNCTPELCSQGRQYIHN